MQLSLPLSLSLSLSHSLSLSPSLSLFISLSLYLPLSLTGEQGVCTPSSPVRERERGMERERDVEYVFQLSRIVIFIFERNDGGFCTF
jgi:hypothetical protein